MKANNCYVQRNQALVSCLSFYIQKHFCQKIVKKLYSLWLPKGRAEGKKRSLVFSLFRCHASLTGILSHESVHWSFPSHWLDVSFFFSIPHVFLVTIPNSFLSHGWIWAMLSPRGEISWRQRLDLLGNWSVFWAWGVQRWPGWAYLEWRGTSEKPEPHLVVKRDFHFKKMVTSFLWS